MSTVNVTATVEADNLPPRVRLDVTDVGAPENFSVTVTRLDPDGRTVPVRTTDGNPLTLSTSGLTRVGLVYDYEMPYGASVQYSTVEDPTSSSGQVTVPSDRSWFVHPGVPELSQRVTIASIGPRTRRVARGVFYPMGRSAPVVQTDGVRKSSEFTLGLYTPGDDEREDLAALLDDGGPLLLNVPVTNKWGLPPQYLSVGDVEELRTTRYIGEPSRFWPMSVTVIDRPAGGSQAERTYVDVLANFPSYADLMPAYSDYLALLSGP